MERKHGVSLPTIDLLEDYLVHAQLSDESSEDHPILAASEMYHKIKPLIESETKEQPFERLPKDERRLMVALKASFEHADPAGVEFNMDEICAVMAARNEKYQREKSLNRWSLPLAIFGLLFTIIFGVISILKGTSPEDLRSIVNAVIEEKIGDVSIVGAPVTDEGSAEGPVDSPQLDVGSNGE